MTRSPAARVVVRDLETLDLTRPMGAVELAGAMGRVVVDADLAGAALDHTLDLGRVGLALEQVGVAQACLDLNVEYAKTRIQFDRPIGSFHTVKHACADMLVAVESA